MDSFKIKFFNFIKTIKKIVASFFINLKSKIFFKRNDSNKQIDIEKKIVYSLSKSRIPRIKQIKYIKKFLSPREAWLLKISFSILIISTIFLGVNFYYTHLQVVPAMGGEYSEGLIGNPKYINPLYSTFSDVDSDITSLVFSSLLKRDNNGKLINDLVEKYEISEDNKIYTFKIRNNVVWHNSTPDNYAPLTIDDIIFTFNIIKEPNYSSPLEKSFIGVEIEKIDESTIRFLLAEPYAAFLELLTFGILPQDLWYKIPSSSAGLAELNLKPIGSGPYKFKSLTKNELGHIISYSLVVNENYYGTTAYIEKINFFFSPNFEEAISSLNSGLIDGISYLPKQFERDLVAKDSLNLYKLNLPQLTAIFLNQNNNNFLADKSVRKAMALALNKIEIVREILDGDARVIDGPILPDSFAYNKEIKKYSHNQEEANKLLDDAGWKIVEITEEDFNIAEEEKENEEDEKKKEELEIKLTMGEGNWRQKDNKYLTIELTLIDTAENLQISEYIKNNLEKAGIKTFISLVQLNQIDIDIIKPRNFEALFYSQILGADPDLYVFWHSSQIGETGLNLANYANKDVDQLLEDARIISDVEVRKEKYNKFQEIIADDLPAIFMYSPVYTYVQSKKIKDFNVKSILIPRDRFSNISNWYTKTRKKLIWKNN